MIKIAEERTATSSTASLTSNITPLRDDLLDAYDLNKHFVENTENSDDERKEEEEREKEGGFSDSEVKNRLNRRKRSKSFEDTNDFLKKSPLVSPSPLSKNSLKKTSSITNNSPLFHKSIIKQKKIADASISVPHLSSISSPSPIVFYSTKGSKHLSTDPNTYSESLAGEGINLHHNKRESMPIMMLNRQMSMSKVATVKDSVQFNCQNYPLFEVTQRSKRTHQMVKRKLILKTDQMIIHQRKKKNQKEISYNDIIKCFNSISNPKKLIFVILIYSSSSSSTTSSQSRKFFFATPQSKLRFYEYFWKFKSENISIPLYSFDPLSSINTNNNNNPLHGNDELIINSNDDNSIHSSLDSDFSIDSPHISSKLFQNSFPSLNQNNNTINNNNNNTNNNINNNNNTNEGFDKHYRTQKFQIFIGTWNMGEAPPSQGLEGWIQRKKAYDLYVIGVQECNFQPREGFSSVESDLFNTFLSYLGTSYVKVAGLSLSQIRVIVIAKREHYNFITHIKSGSFFFLFYFNYYSLLSSC